MSHKPFFSNLLRGCSGRQVSDTWTKITCFPYINNTNADDSKFKVHNSFFQKRNRRTNNKTNTKKLECVFFFHRKTRLPAERFRIIAVRVFLVETENFVSCKDKIIRPKNPSKTCAPQGSPVQFRKYLFLHLFNCKPQNIVAVIVHAVWKNLKLVHKS